ncbi:MAG: SDR family oxidoreductase, partial [Deltaproteobacteria bacterium]|nr:SDR family oxidoreductase [Deltaproteobacteria bacterium]
DSLCPTCAPVHYAKRTQTADLRGKIALVTGARVTSGHAIALKLLRAGATVIGTTRFPRDAAARFATEPDFTTWRDRLHLHGLDFRAAGWVEAFADHLARSFHALHILINNAAQTVRRPAPFYAHLVAGECASEVPVALRPLLASDTAMSSDAPPGLAARMSQAQVLPEDARALPGTSADALDLRDHNTWTLGLGAVASAECLETLLVNAAAPFILTGRLRALMNRDPLADKWVVNVTAVEGQFARAQKSGRHPHLDMAKAALNMLTRSAADDYARDRIYMNSVDVGWFSSGEPAPVIAAMQAQGFALPIDVIDAASRACDPIFTGVATGVQIHGKLLKNYAPVAW